MQSNQVAIATSALLVREGQTNFAPFTQPDLSIAHVQWLQVLKSRMDQLENARELSLNFDLGGTFIDSDLVAPLEELVDEARRMVYSLNGEMRRRSEGNLPPWIINKISYEISKSKMARANSAGQ
ncbi:uncharacterized protein I206_105505 [Kwoniella pini CBS 10737]|uniref:Uncharacterized protein n=1 Tax=Kwoniella pini CBS 10737 TaxID=1296096 RepID=A0A1B9I418_9TREE|nr:uncharacterized protein I206_03592 [Kwoniella pini CBS 10737]OCF50273.1 hypothetical protein I206_03592 [Kwoniella pini CBS 10737]